MAKVANSKGPDWLTKQEAARLLGVSIRSIERLVERGAIKQKFLRVANRRPIAVLSPSDVEKAKTDTLEKVPPALTQEVMPSPITQEVAALLPRAILPDLLTTLAHALGEIQGHTLKVFVDLAEASQLTGLTETHLRRLIATGRLAGIKDRGMKVRRSDLLRL